MTPITANALIPNACNCVIFRLDGVQDYWINTVQNAVMDKFIAKNEKVNIGIYGNYIGNDPTIVSKVNFGLQSGTFELDVSGWNYVDYTTLSLQQQKDTLQQTNTKFQSLWGKSSVTFTPPLNSYNSNTLQALKDDGFKIISSKFSKELNLAVVYQAIPNSDIKDSYGIYHLSQEIEFYDQSVSPSAKIPLSTIMTHVNAAINQYGYAVVTLYPQDFSVKNSSNAPTNVVKTNEVTDLDTLITTIKNNGYTIRTFSFVTIPLDNIPPTAAITYSTAGPYKSGNIVTITATFSEPVKDLPVPQLSISGANTLAATNMVKSSSTVYTYSRTIGTGDGTATIAMATAQDLAGNPITSAPSSGATHTIDNTAPVITRPPDITIHSPLQFFTISLSTLGTATAVDNFDPSPIITNDAAVPLANGFPQGTTIVTWTATDKLGNSAIATQKVTISNDSIPKVQVAGWWSSEVGSGNQYWHDQTNPSYWTDVAWQMSSKFPYSSPGGVLVIGFIEGINSSQNTFLSFPKPTGTYPNVDFGTIDAIEPLLTAYDNAGLKVYLEVQPADADVPMLMDLVMNRYKQHPSVIGFGVDVEWYHQSQYPGFGRPLTNTEVNAWAAKVKTFDPNYKLMLVHWDSTYLSSARPDNVVFTSDDLDLGSLAGATNSYVSWVDAFAPSQVGFDIGYIPDMPWWNLLSDPASSIVNSVIDARPNANIGGVFWVNFTVLKAFPINSVPDTEKPVITPHADVTAAATSATGAIISYTLPTTSDNIDPPGVAVCSPGSGALFAIGTTQVICTATDAAGNQATPITFNVIITNVNVHVAGWRSSEYGNDNQWGHDQTDPAYWISVAQKMSAKFPGFIPGGVLVIGEIDGAPGTATSTFLPFPKPAGTFLNVNFGTIDAIEPLLTAYDNAGLKVYLQVESADADVPMLMDLIMNRYKQHPSVIGFGVDVEWYHQKQYSDGRPLTDAELTTWAAQVKTFNPDYTLMVKHWDWTFLSNARPDNVLFVTDSEQIGSLSAATSEYIAWIDHFGTSKIGFQIGYPSDMSWWSTLTDPASSIINPVITARPNANIGAIFWVDFSVLRVFPSATAPNITINDVTQAEGNTGTSNFVFTVTRSSNVGAISVNYVTADNSAIAPTDYAAKSSTILNFAAGGPLTQTATISVNGDTAVEPNDTFFVNLSNCVGCSITDSQGVGTITNDDSANPQIFSDTFQSGFGKWTETGEGDWNLEAPAEKQVPSHTSNIVAHSDNCDTTCTITLSVPIDLRLYSSTTLTFWRYVDNDLDNGEYLKVEMYNGATWNTVFNWTNNSGDDDTWHQETVNLGSYLSAGNFNLRFVTHESSASEDTEIDDVMINGVLKN